MSCFRNLAHVLYHTKYHLIWTHKYCYRVLSGPVKSKVESSIRGFMSLMGYEVVEPDVQPNHVHMVSWILPKHSVSEVMGVVKRRTSIRVFKQFPWLRQKPYWRELFLGAGYCVDTVGIDEDESGYMSDGRRRGSVVKRPAVTIRVRVILTCKV